MTMIYICIILSLIILYLIYIRNKVFKQIDNGDYPITLFLDRDKYLNFYIGKLIKPRRICIFYDNKENPGRSTYEPIKCETDTNFEYWKSVFKTIGDVWDWERNEFYKYKQYVETYLMDKKNDE